MSRDRWIWLLILGLIVTGFLIGMPIGFPLDDAWIFTVFAANLRNLGEWSYNPGEPCAGVTSLLWTWLLSWIPESSGYPFRSEVIGARTLSLLLSFLPLALCLPTIFASGLAGSNRFRHRVGGILSLIALGHGIWLFHAFSGMETTLFVSTGVCAIYFFHRSNHWLSGLFCFFLVLIRLEGFLLGGLLLVANLFSAINRSLWKRPWVGVSACLSGTGAGVVSVAVHNYRLFGNPFPATFAGRRFLFGLDPDRIHWTEFGNHLHGFTVSWIERVHDWYWMDNFLPGQISVGGAEVHPLSLLFSAVAFIGFLVFTIRIFEPGYWRRMNPIFLLTIWAFLHNLLYTAVLPTGAHAGRYQAMNYLLVPYWTAFGGQELIRFALNFRGMNAYTPRRRIAERLTYVWVVILIIPTAVSFLVWKDVMTLGIERIQNLHMAMGMWAEGNLPEDSRIVAFDLGGIAMTTDLYIIDQSGLLDDRGLESFRKHNSPTFYRERGATHLFRFERLDDPTPTFDPAWKTGLTLLHRLSLPEEIGLDREACQNTWSRCSMYRIEYLEGE
ncbi:MAG: hypothetical protein KC944_04350 [Candidatus Omnitrophica bacterium]|nr:hypothetical protein [Candidatus Omnitrophota bacterium]